MTRLMSRPTCAYLRTLPGYYGTTLKDMIRRKRLVWSDSRIKGRRATSTLCCNRSTSPMRSEKPFTKSRQRRMRSRPTVHGPCNDYFTHCNLASWQSPQQISHHHSDGIHDRYLSNRTSRNCPEFLWKSL